MPVPGLFFGAEPPAARTALAGGRHCGQAGLNFATPAADRFAIQSGDAGEVAITGTICFEREHAHIPAALGLGEATQKEIDALVAGQGLGIASSLADRTLTHVYSWLWTSDH
jgi:hypothetical protein